MKENQITYTPETLSLVAKNLIIQTDGNPNNTRILFNSKEPPFKIKAVEISIDARKSKFMEVTLHI